MVWTWTGRESRQLRQALRLTVRAFAEDLGVSPRTISKWEQAGATLAPRPELQAALDTMLERATPEEQRRFTLATEASVLPAQSAKVTQPDVGAALASSAAEASTFAVWWESTTAGPFGIDTVFSELTRLSRDYLDGPPEPIVLALGNVRQLIFNLLREPQSPSQAQDLHLAAGYVCVLLSWLGGDFGQLGAAHTHARAGALFAETSGSAELQAWVRAARSKTLFWSGDYRRAAELAMAGSAAAPPSGVRVLLAAQAADAYVALDAHEPARAALAEVASAREALNSEDVVGGLLSCPPAREANYVSGVHQVLGSVRTGGGVGGRGAETVTGSAGAVVRDRSPDPSQPREACSWT